MKRPRGVSEYDCGSGTGPKRNACKPTGLIEASDDHAEHALGPG
jgi:hypothetical protein